MSFESGQDPSDDPTEQDLATERKRNRAAQAAAGRKDTDDSDGDKPKDKKDAWKPSVTIEVRDGIAYQIKESPLESQIDRAHISSDQNIDVMLKSARDYKTWLENLRSGAVPASEATGVLRYKDATGPDRMMVLMGKKADVLAGITGVDNEPKESLDDVDPALARRMEEAWAKLQNDSKRGNEYRSRPTGSAASALDALAGAEGALNRQLSLQPLFTPAAAGESRLPKPSPPSAAPGKPKLQAT